MSIYLNYYILRREKCLFYFKNKIRIDNIYDFKRAAIKWARICALVSFLVYLLLEFLFLEFGYVDEVKYGFNLIDVVGSGMFGKPILEIR